MSFILHVPSSELNECFTEQTSHVCSKHKYVIEEWKRYFGAVVLCRVLTESELWMRTGGTVFTTAVYYTWHLCCTSGVICTPLCRNQLIRVIAENTEKSWHVKGLIACHRDCVRRCSDVSFTTVFPRPAS